MFEMFCDKMWRYSIVLGILFTIVIGSNEKASEETKWPGNWFPKAPGAPDPVLAPKKATPRPQPHFNRDGKWTGNWFPNKPQIEEETGRGREGMTGEVAHEKFHEINNEITDTMDEGGSVKKQLNMGSLDPQCDDTKTNLSLDYDPELHQSRYICAEDRSLYNPNKSIRPILLQYDIPTEYSALHECMNVTINYTDNIPTFGTHRPNWPVYGEYDYAPVQRWLHSLEHGAIVGLYHPCANRRLVNKMRKLIKSCLYRHVITAYENLTIERPFALVAWGKSLEMSYINHEVMLAFMRMNAIQAPEKISRDGLYTVGLIEKANVVSDINDSNLCPNM